MIFEEPEEIKNEAAEASESAESLEQALAAEKKKAEENLAGWQRAQADFLNYKRRTEQEKQEFNRFANASLVCNILPILDDLERALNAIPEAHIGDDWVEGVRLVERKFKTVLEGQGVKPILCLGMEFDPRYHEALRKERGEEGMVIGELQKGYMLNEKLLRPARVVVGSGKEEDKKKQADTKEAE